MRRIAARWQAALSLGKLQLAELPSGTAEIFLGPQGRVAVERIDDEQRALVTDGHVGAVALQREQDVELREVGDRDRRLVVFERRGDRSPAIGANGLDEANHWHAFEGD